MITKIHNKMLRNTQHFATKYILIIVTCFTTDVYGETIGVFVTTSMPVVLKLTMIEQM